MIFSFMTEKRLKITYLITKGVFGGAQRYVYELASALPETDYEVSVVFGDGEVLEKKLQLVKIRTIRIKSLGRDLNFWRDLESFWALWKLFRQEKPDIIHLNSSKIGGLGALAGRLAGVKKIIFTGHGWSFNEDRFWLEKKILAFGHWLTIILAHQTIAVSQQVYDQVAIWPGVKNKITLIYNGIDKINFLSERDARLLLLPNKIDKFWLGTIAELHHNKGLDILIETFARLVKSLISSELGWSLYLVIIGEGEERGRLEKLISAKRLEGRIILLGQVEEARKYLKAFDVFILPSRTEAFPYALLEAGYAGLPIVASEVGGIPEIIPDAESGLLVPPGNVIELEKSLKYMITKDHYRALVGPNIEKKIKADFSFKEMLKETMDLYQTK